MGKITAQVIDKVFEFTNMFISEQEAKEICQLFERPQSLTTEDTSVITNASEVTGIWDRGEPKTRERRE